MDQNFLLSLKIFEDNSINYWVCHGTLLGLIRDKKLIEWDHDIDFGLWYDEINKEKLINLFQKKGFNLVSDGDGYDFITFNRGNGKRVDINLYRVNKKNNLAYSVAVGKAGAFFKIPLEQLLTTFMQSFVSNLVNVGIKHIPLGQSDGQKILIKLLPIVKELALNYKNYEIDDIGTSTFISDLTSMYHETLNNRIYQT